MNHWDAKKALLHSGEVESHFRNENVLCNAMRAISVTRIIQHICHSERPDVILSEAKNLRLSTFRKLFGTTQLLEYTIFRTTQGVWISLNGKYLSVSALRKTEIQTKFFGGGSGFWTFLTYCLSIIS